MSDGQSTSSSMTGAGYAGIRASRLSATTVSDESATTGAASFHISPQALVLRAVDG